MRKHRGVAPLVLALLVSACAPRVRALTGVTTDRTLPATSLPRGYTRLVFRWDYGDPLFSARGEGVARIAPPDSVRLDFFVDGNMGSGFAILVGDELSTPANDDARRYLPPVPLLWAALGVLRVTGADTLTRLEGDTLRAEIGAAPTWRAAMIGPALHSLHRIEGNRLRESVERDSIVTTYRNLGSRRRLTLTVVRRFADPPFDAAIWRR